MSQIPAVKVLDLRIPGLNFRLAAMHDPIVGTFLIAYFTTVESSKTKTAAMLRNVLE